MKNVLILGAKSGIGFSLARLLAKEKNQIVLAARDAGKSLSERVSDLEIRGAAKVTALEFDALDFGSHQSFYANLDPKPDLVVCAFGYLGDSQKARTDQSESARIIDTNYKGAVSILDIVANDFEERSSGTIVGISSVAGERGRQSNYHYGSSKAAFTAYLSGLRNRLQGDVDVVTVKPGFVRTNMTKGLDLPAPVTAEPSRAARDILSGINKKRNVVYTLWIWRWIMLLIRAIPEFIFKRLKL